MEMNLHMVAALWLLSRWQRGGGEVVASYSVTLRRSIEENLRNSQKSVRTNTEIKL